MDGGYAEPAVADERFLSRYPRTYVAPEAAPLLCAGLIGYRALRLAGDAERLGLYGFGALRTRLPGCAPSRTGVFAFTRADDSVAQELARSRRGMGRRHRV